jgi:hypothetical protein
VADHLAGSERPRDWSELVLWVGEGSVPPELTARGFAVERVTSGDLQRFGVEAAPTLIALDPFGRVRYAGGYTERKQAAVVADLRILQAVRSGDTVDGLPIFGCAVSDRLKGELASLPSP